MDFTTAAGIGGAAATGVLAVLGWVLKRSVGQMDQKLREHDEALQRRSDELSAYKLHVAEHYVTTNELSKAIDALNETIKAVFQRFDRLESKLDNKADK
ncbi:MAG: hypothetical protein AAFO57_00140 [Pseudomonadota bacterium]